MKLLPLLATFTLIHSTVFSQDIEVSAVINGPASSVLGVVDGQSFENEIRLNKLRLRNGQSAVIQTAKESEKFFVQLERNIDGKKTNLRDRVNIGYEIPVEASVHDGYIRFHGTCRITTFSDSKQDISDDAQKTLTFASFTRYEVPFAGKVHSEDSVSIPLPFPSSPPSALTLTFVTKDTEQDAAANP